MMNPAAAGGDGGDAGAWTATVTHQESYGDEEEITTHQTGTITHESRVRAGPKRS